MVFKMRTNANVMRFYLVMTVYQYIIKIIKLGFNILNDIAELVMMQLTHSYMKEIELDEVIFRVGENGCIPVYCSDKILAVGGMPKRMPASIATLDILGQPIIILNGRILDEQAWFVDAMIEHEIGHINKQLKGVKTNHDVRIVMKKMMTLKADYEADVYAAKNHDMFRLLSRLHDMGCDVSKRIEHLYESIHG